LPDCFKIEHAGVLWVPEGLRILKFNSVNSSWRMGLKLDVFKSQ